MSLRITVPARWLTSVCTCLLLIVLMGSANFALAGQPCGVAGFRPQDQLWLVSDRGLGCAVPQADQLHVWRYTAESSWTKSTLDELLAAEDPEAATTIFVHGNRIPWCDSFLGGWSAYRALVRSADERPVRFVIWSWPSSPVRGLIFDAQLKAGRTNQSGLHLAWFIDRLHPEAPISLWGHSFGARIVTGAMHVLGGGQLSGQQLTDRVHPERAPMNAVLVVAALDNHWLAPGQAHGMALSQAAAMLLINNSCDAVLKRYHLIYGRRCNADAVGYRGPYLGALADEDRGKVRQIDACCYVGKRHLFNLYIGAPSLLASMRATLLPEPSQPAEAEQPIVAAAP